MVSYSIVNMSPCDAFVRRRSITISYSNDYPPTKNNASNPIASRIYLPHSLLRSPAIINHHPSSPCTSHRTRRLSLARSLWLVCGLQCRHVDGQFHCQTSSPLCFIEHDGETKICEFRVMSPYLFLPVCPSAAFLPLL